ncbi:MAG: hypothetical protein ABFR36_01485 [Acidobacteriota bacterium]
MKQLIFILIILFFSTLYPQYVNYDQYPPGINWKYIDTAKFRIVFPVEITGEGQRVANLLEYIYPEISSAESQGKRFTLFLPNSGIFSNGYIQLAPQKGEFFFTPPQSGFNGNTDWYSILSLHEGKHVDQFDRLNRGFTKLGGLIFGDMGRAALSFLSIPLWFWEGEAVCTETEYSSGGRGILPSFSMSTRSILLSGKRYKYIKSYLSSYKDHVPDVYRLGYFLTSYLRKNYPEESIEKILKFSSSYSFYPLIFSRALKKETGMNVDELYNRAMDDLHKIWTKRDRKLEVTEFSGLNLPIPEIWTLYTSPQMLSGGDIIALKYGLGSSLKVVRISPEGDEKKISSINTVSHINSILSTGDGKIVWDEPVRDLRWGNRSYSEIVVFDLKYGKKKRITRRSRLFSPSISHDGKFIAAVGFSKLRETTLTIVRTSDSKIINKFNSPGNSFLLTPTWDISGKKIVMIRMAGGKKTVTIFDIDKEIFRDILELSHNSYSTPSFFGNYIIFSSPRTGIDNIHAVEISSGKQFMITGSRFGAFYPSVSNDNESLIYSEYDQTGMSIVKAPIDIKKWIPFENRKKESTEYFIRGEKPPDKKDLTNIPQQYKKKYPVKNYSRLKDLINFHSRVIIPDRVNPAVELYSGNKLNTTFITAGFSFNTNEERGKFYTEAVYAGFFPVLKAGFSRNGRKIIDPALLSWEETNKSLSISIPLNLSKGVYVRKLNIGSEISSTSVSGSDENSGYRVAPGNINSLSYNLRYSNFKHLSKRDLAPLSGQFISIRYSFTPWDTYYTGNKFSAFGSIYFSGLFPHNSLRIGVSYEKQNPVNYIFSSNINFSRGYDFKYIKNLIFASLDYSFPIAYPDLAIGELLYLKRIKGTVFTDLGKGYDINGTKYFNSAGFELTGDINLFSIPVDLDVGLRVTYRFVDNSFRFDPIFLGISF